MPSNENIDEMYRNLDEFMARMAVVQRNLEQSDESSKIEVRVKLLKAREVLDDIKEQVSDAKNGLVRMVAIVSQTSKRLIPELSILEHEFSSVQRNAAEYVKFMRSWVIDQNGVDDLHKLDEEIAEFQLALQLLEKLKVSFEAAKVEADNRNGQKQIPSAKDGTDGSMIASIINKYNQPINPRLSSSNSASTNFYAQKVKVQQLWFNLRLHLMATRNRAIDQHIKQLQSVIHAAEKRLKGSKDVVHFNNLFFQLHEVAKVLRDFKRKEREKVLEILEQQQTLQDMWKQLSSSQDNLFKAQWPVAGNVSYGAEVVGTFPLDQYQMKYTDSDTNNCRSNGERKRLELFNTQRLQGQLMAPEPLSYQKDLFTIASTGSGKTNAVLAAIAEWLHAAIAKRKQQEELSNNVSNRKKRAADIRSQNAKYKEYVKSEFDQLDETDLDDDILSEEPIKITREVLIMFKETTHIGDFVTSMTEFFDPTYGVETYRISPERAHSFVPILISSSTRAYLFDGFFQVVLQCYHEPMLNAATLFPESTTKDYQNVVPPHMFKRMENSLYPRNEIKRFEVVDEVLRETERILKHVISCKNFFVPNSALIVIDEFHGFTNCGPELSIQQQLSVLAWAAILMSTTNCSLMTLTATPFTDPDNTMNWFRLFNIHLFNQHGRVPEWYSVKVPVTGKQKQEKQVKLMPVWFVDQSDWGFVQQYANVPLGPKNALALKRAAEGHASAYEHAIKALWRQMLSALEKPKTLKKEHFEESIQVLKAWERKLSERMFYEDVQARVIRPQLRNDFQQLHAGIISYYTVANDQTRFPTQILACTEFSNSKKHPNRSDRTDECYLVRPSGKLELTPAPIPPMFMNPIRNGIMTIPVDLGPNAGTVMDDSQTRFMAFASIYRATPNQKHFVFFERTEKQRQLGMDQMASYIMNNLKMAYFSEWRLMKSMLILQVTTSTIPNSDLFTATDSLNGSAGLPKMWAKYTPTQLAELFYKGGVEIKKFYQDIPQKYLDGWGYTDMDKLPKGKDTTVRLTIDKSSFRLDPHTKKEKSTYSVADIMQFFDANNGENQCIPKRSAVMMYKVDPHGTNDAGFKQIQKVCLHAKHMPFSDQLLLWNRLDQMIRLEETKLGKAQQSGAIRFDQIPLQPEDDDDGNYVPSDDEDSDDDDADASEKKVEEPEFEVEIKDQAIFYTDSAAPQQESDEFTKLRNSWSRKRYVIDGLRSKKNMSKAEKELLESSKLMTDFRWDNLMLALYNHPDNRSGDYFGVLVGNMKISESITLRDTYNTHFLEPPSSSLIRQQTTGRSNRTCNQSAPETINWWTRTFTYIGSTDEAKAFSLEGTDVSSTFMRLIREDAVDCIYNKEYNIGGNKKHEYNCVTEAIGYEARLSGDYLEVINRQTGQVFKWDGPGSVSADGIVSLNADMSGISIPPIVLKNYYTSLDTYTLEFENKRTGTDLAESFKAVQILLHYRTIICSEIAWLADAEFVQTNLMKLHPTHMDVFVKFSKELMATTTPSIIQRTRDVITAFNSFHGNRTQFEQAKKEWNDKLLTIPVELQTEETSQSQQYYEEALRYPDVQMTDNPQKTKNSSSPFWNAFNFIFK